MTPRCCHKSVAQSAIRTVPAHEVLVAKDYNEEWKKRVESPRPGSNRADKERPHCFGSTTMFSDDEVCQECRFYEMCSEVVDRKIAYAAREHDRSRQDIRPTTMSSSGPRGPTSTLPVLRDEPKPEPMTDAQASFVTVLGFNSGLRAAEAVFYEVLLGIRSIPKFVYPDPFLERRKK